MIFPRYNKKRRDRVTYRTDGLDYCNLFPITRLGLLGLCPTIRACYNHSGRDNAYYKPSLVEVVDIRLADRILSDCILHKLESAPNYLWIFAFSPLVIVFPLKTRSELWSSSHKVFSLAWSDAFALMRREKSICYIFYYSEPRRKPFGG